MLREQLRDSLKSAMKQRDQVKITTLRLITNTLKERDRINTQEEGLAELTDSEIMLLIQGMIKQRQESIKAYMDGGRDDLVAQETREKDILQSFLPQALEGEALQQAIDTAIAEIQQRVGTNTPLPNNAIGQVIGLLKAQYPGQIDMGKASGLIKSRLTA